MFDALKEITGLFDRRFFMYVFVPGLFLWVTLIVIWFAGQGRLATALVSWNQQEALPKTIEIVCFLMFIYLFSSVLGILSPSIIRFYEGYWTFPGAQYIRDFGVRRHQAILNDLYAESSQVENDGEAYERIYYFYPLPTFHNRDVMPTALGNILKNSETYAAERYELDSVLVWPRLHKLFPPEFTEEVALLRASLDFMLLTSSLSIAFVVLSGAYLIIVQADWRLFALCFWGGLLLSWVTFKSALGSALAYASQIKVAFDLYRERLLVQMRIPLPANATEEQKTWTNLGALLYEGTPIPLPYATQTANTPAKLVVKGSSRYGRRHKHS